MVVTVHYEAIFLKIKMRKTVKGSFQVSGGKEISEVISAELNRL
jgi:hypothetical protein